MSSLRRQALDNLDAVLQTVTELLPALTVLDPNQDAPVQEDEYPALILHDGGHLPNEESHGRSVYILTPMLDGYVTAATPGAIRAALDDLYVAVVAKVLGPDADRTLGGIAVDLREGELRTSVAREAGAPPTGNFELDLTIEIHTKQGVPSEAPGH